MNQDVILAINNAEVIYNKAVQVLRGLSLQVPRGSIVALLGSNGAGKTTTLKAVSNLLALEDGEMTKGEVLLDGQPTARMKPHELVRAGLCHVMEGRHVFEDLTVEENLVAATYALAGRKAGRAEFDLVYEYFPRLYERRKGLAGYLSGGEQQMLAIGRALVGNPRLLLLDEPSDGLAPNLVAEVMALLDRLRSSGMSVLLVEQDLAAALSVADRVAVLDRGTVSFEAPVPGLDRSILEDLLMPV